MKIATLLLPVIALSACGVLKPVEDHSENHILAAISPSRAVTGNTPSIAIARPSLPGYIDRQQLVTRSRNGTIVMNANQIWAEPLDDGIARVTAENLGIIRNSMNIQPVQAFITIDYTHLLEMRVSRFDADAGTRSVVLECTWKLQPVSGRVAPARAFRTEVPIEDPGFSAASPQQQRVQAMNQALAELAAVIARQL
ncbi:MAG: membrane integrity-associated transporter subunit PqiC [Luteolibacter sp.]